MKTYTLTQFAAAREYLQLIEDTNQDTTHLFVAAMIIECNQVISFYNKLYTVARTFIGAWHIRIKLAWDYLTSDHLSHKRTNWSDSTIKIHRLIFNRHFQKSKARQGIKQIIHNGLVSNNELDIKLARLMMVADNKNLKFLISTFADFVSKYS